MQAGAAPVLVVAHPLLAIEPCLQGGPPQLRQRERTQPLTKSRDAKGAGRGSGRGIAHANQTPWPPLAAAAHPCRSSMYRKQQRQQHAAGTAAYLHDARGAKLHLVHPPPLEHAHTAADGAEVFKVGLTLSFFKLF